MTEHVSVRRDRRRFLGSLGAVAAGVAALGGGTPAAASERDADRDSNRQPPAGHFGRMFPGVPPFAEASPAVTAALLELGKPGGILDARDDLSAGPVRLITDPTLSLNNPDNPSHTAGTTFFGQFLDHDMTFDVGSPLGVPTRPEDAVNGRTPAFDLDSLYGGGPVVSPALFDPADRARLRIESGGLFEDLPRAADSTAIIGDPRNDENLIIAGLHAAFIRFHNRMVDELRAARLADDDHDDDHAGASVLRRARRLTTWHYHWLIIHEFLPLFVGQDLVDDIMQKGRRFFVPERAFMPVEFQGAVYRFGHSMVRPSYRANLAGDAGNPFFGFIFDPSLERGPDPGDLSGGARAPRRFIGWQTFFDFNDGQVKRNKRIDTHLSTPLFNLPLRAIPTHAPPTVLPQRTLLRHLTWSLPAGQTLARVVRVPVLSARDLDELHPYGFAERTPLWYYILKEAEVVESGLHLGPLGGRIVAEVILGLLQLDHHSYLVQRPDWRPSVPSRFGPGEFRMVDFLTFAGVDPHSRGQ